MTGGMVPPGTSVVLFPNGTITTPNTTACVERCGKQKCCLLQFNLITKQCSYGDLDVDEHQTEAEVEAEADGSGPSGNTFDFGFRITYKRPTNPLACLIGQSNSATQYNRCKLLTQVQVDAYASLGLNLDPWTAQLIVLTRQWDSVKNENDCRRKCNYSLLCWGFVYNADSKSCLYRGGTDFGMTGVLTWQTFLV